MPECSQHYSLYVYKHISSNRTVNTCSDIGDDVAHIGKVIENMSSSEESVITNLGLKKFLLQ